jgi:hypothetical protein
VVASNLAPVISPLGAQRGSFVVTLGSDTVQVESFTRVANRLEGTVVMRVPRTVLVSYVLDLDDAGLPKRYQATTTLGDGKQVATAGLAAFLYDRDSITRTLLVRGDTVRQRIAATPGTVPGPSIPYLGVSIAMYEVAFAAARKSMSPAGESAIHQLTLVASQARVFPTRVWFIGADSVEMDYFGVTRSGFKLDGDGRIVRADWRSTTYKYRMTRTSDFDVSAAAQAWHDADLRLGVPGPLSRADTLTATVGGASLTIRYSRPAKRGRQIWGGLVPWDRVWRFGADRATHLETTGNVRLGDVVLPAGRYTLWMLPSPREPQLIVSTLTNVWGTAYDPANDFARIPMTAATVSAPVERFELAIEGGNLVAKWDRSVWSVPITGRPASTAEPAAADGGGAPIRLTSPGNWKPSSRIVIGTDSADIFVVSDGREQHLARTTWTATMTECDGRQALELRVGTGLNYVTCIDAASHAPILTRYRSARDSFDVRFRGSIARGWVVWGGQPRREINETFASVPFVGVAVEHLLGAFPLAEGYATEIELYAPYAPVGRNRLRVIRSERIDFRGTAREAWLVELSSAGRPGQNVRRFWIDRETGRLLQRENGSPQGSGIVQRTR